MVRFGGQGVCLDTLSPGALAGPLALRRTRANRLRPSEGQQPLKARPGQPPFSPRHVPDAAEDGAEGHFRNGREQPESGPRWRHGAVLPPPVLAPAFADQEAQPSRSLAPGR